jgi:hypothetical protein
MVLVQVNSPRVEYGEDFIRSEYSYESSQVKKGPGGNFTVSFIFIYHIFHSLVGVVIIR